MRECKCNLCNANVVGTIYYSPELESYPTWLVCTSCMSRVKAWFTNAGFKRDHPFIRFMFEGTVFYHLAHWGEKTSESRSALIETG